MKNHENNADEVVEVIEQSDHRARLFIGAAAIAGLALGGLLGTIYAQNKWQAVIHHYQEQTTRLNEEYQLLIESVKTDKKMAQQELAEFKEQISEQTQKESAEQVSQLSKQAVQLEEVNDQLNAETKQLEEQIATQQSQIVDLERKLSLQTTMFDRARELFKKEEQLKQELETLFAEQIKLAPQAEKLNQECNLFLEGKSWEARSDVCERHDEINAKMGQNEQMIAIHQLDLKEIEALSEELGL
jgi:esterase/lipase